jgi:hypothetical protein
MPVNPLLTTTVPAGKPYYRITGLSFRTTRVADRRQVVNGQGAVRSRHGAYNYPGATTVYLAEDLETCFAERMFYFQREVLTAIDSSHLPTGAIPAFVQRFILWEVELKTAVPAVFDLTAHATAAHVFPSLMLNPSQDYYHLKDRRAAIQSEGYQGLRAPSSRVRRPGSMVVLFTDQSRNVLSITPFDVEFRLVTAGTATVPFANHAVDLLDFTAGEVRFVPPLVGVPPAGSGPYLSWARVEFNH